MVAVELSLSLSRTVESVFFLCFVLTTDGRTPRAGEGDGDAGVLFL